MKFLTLALITAILTTTGICHASSGADPEKARTAMPSVAKVALSIDGALGIRLATCNPTTGERETRNNFVYCISIGTTSEKSFNELSKLFPTGSDKFGVFVVIDRPENVICPRPRMGAGN